MGWGDTSSDEDHHHRDRHNDEANKEATPESVGAVSYSCFRSTMCVLFFLGGVRGFGLGSASW